MMHGMAKSSLLSPEEESELASKCIKAKKSVWKALLLEPKYACWVIDAALSYLPKKTAEKVDEEILLDVKSAARGWLVSQSPYRKKRWKEARAKGVSHIVKCDACLRSGVKIASVIGRWDGSGHEKWLARVNKRLNKFICLRNEFITKNIRLVAFVAKRYKNYGVPYEDLIQEGTFGLQRAIDLYDPEMGNKFSTYSIWWIRASVQRYLRDRGRIVRIPVHLQETFDRYQKVTEKRGYAPDDSELSEHWGCSENKIERLKSMSKTDYLSIDSKISKKGDYKISDTIPAEDQFELCDAKIDIGCVYSAMDSLPERERYIIKCRFGLDGGDEKTLQEIANVYEMSRERVRQLQVKAMEFLRKKIVDDRGAFEFNERGEDCTAKVLQ